MRKKTKRLLIGAGIGAVVTLLLVLVAGYFIGYRPYHAKISQYEQLLDTYRNPETKGVYRVNKDIKSHQQLSDEDFEVIQMPAKIYNAAMLDASVPIKGMSVNSDIVSGTILHDSMVYLKDEMPKDLRVFEFSNLMTESRLNVDDIVDVRINFPSGLDYVVLSKKRLIDKVSLYEEDDPTQPNLCIFYLNEDEILRTSSALVDAYMHEGAYLYTTKYISTNSQEKAEITYPVNEDVEKLIASDPNIVDRAMVALQSHKRSELSNSLAEPDANSPTPTTDTVSYEPETIPQETQPQDADLDVGSVVD